MQNGYGILIRKIVNNKEQEKTCPLFIDKEDYKTFTPQDINDMVKHCIDKIK